MPTVITNINQLDFSKQYTYADYLKWQFEERIELLKGFIARMAAPNVYHQRISGDLQYQIQHYLRKSPCSVFTAPFDVRLTRKNKITNKEVMTVVQPDLCIICDKNKLDKRGCIGAPDWIIEILSPGNSKKEMKEKFEIYEESGVREYWLVQPDDKAVFVYVLNEVGKYIGLQPFTEDDIAPSFVFPDLQINLKDVFEDK
jgi:Uma2 family endonuclease